MADQKAIWGSTRYFIKIEPYTNVFGTSMSGIVSFYDTHGLINEKECRNLLEIVDTVNEFWSTILAPHETRVARWIEEYLIEIGIAGDYNLLLRLLRSDDLFAEDLDDIIKETREVDTEEIEKAFGVDEDSRILGHEITITRLPEDEYLRNELLQKLIEDNKYHVPSTVKSRSQFKLASGEVKTIEKENPLEVGETLKDVTLISGLKNEEKEAITDVEIIDEMPYCFAIENMEIGDLEIQPNKEKKEKVLEIIWEIPEIKPKEEVEINYKLSKRINRTILEIIQNEVIAVLNAFENISIAGLEFTSNVKYLNIHNRQLQELHIIDEIPPEFTIVKTNPEAIPPNAVVEKIKLKGINVRWKHKNVAANQALDKIYKLDYFPYLFRGKKIIQNKEGRTIFKAAKFIKSSERDMGYSILYVIKNIQGDVAEFISLADKFPASHAIVGKFPEDSQIMEQIDDAGDKIITWIVEPPPISKVTSVEVKVSGDTSPTFEMFQIFVGEKSEKEVLEKESSVSRELVKSP
jgi:hypothetical protein